MRGGTCPKRKVKASRKSAKSLDGDELLTGTQAIRKNIKEQREAEGLREWKVSAHHLEVATHEVTGLDRQ